MNISCTAEGLPRSECLFFKVFGTTQVTNGQSLSLATVQSIGMSTKSSISFSSAKFNFSVQGTTDNNILCETTTVMTTFTTSQVTDTLTTSPVNVTTTADSKIDIPPLANETDRSDLITTTAGPVKTNKINDHGLQVGSFQYYMIVAAGGVVAVVALTAIVILVIYVTICMRNKQFKFSLEVIRRIPRQRQRSRNSNIEETPSADVSILPDIDLTPVESSQLESPIHSPSSDADYEEVYDRSLPPRKCDRLPVYIFRGPKESDPPFPKSSIECKQNLSYLHLGPEDSSTSASLQCKPITCKKNTAYIHLDPD